MTSRKTKAASAAKPGPARPGSAQSGPAQPVPAQPVPAHELVEALFAVVVDEARRNEAFARRLLSVYPRAVVARIEKPEKRNAAFDASQYHAITILRNHGEAMLRGRLSTLRTKTQLRQVARRSGLKLTGPSARAGASMAKIIDGIVEAAKTYEAQRAATLR